MRRALLRDHDYAHSSRCAHSRLRTLVPLCSQSRACETAVRSRASSEHFTHAYRKVSKNHFVACLPCPAALWGLKSPAATQDPRARAPAGQAHRQRASPPRPRARARPDKSPRPQRKIQDFDRPYQGTGCSLGRPFNTRAHRCRRGVRPGACCLPRRMAAADPTRGAPGARRPRKGQSTRDGQKSCS